MFRCPNCGEKAFSNYKKMTGLSAWYNKCPNCKERSQHRTYRNIQSFNISILTFFALSVLSGYLIIKLNFPIITIFFAFIIFFIFDRVLNYYFSYLYAYTIKEEKSFALISVYAIKNKKLWPTIRYGEIYVIVPAGLNNPNIEEIQTIAQLIKIEKNENEKLLRFRVIRKSQETQLKHNAEVVIINDFDSEKYRMIKGRIL